MQAEDQTIFHKNIYVNVIPLSALTPLQCWLQAPGGGPAPTKLSVRCAAARRPRDSASSAFLQLDLCPGQGAGGLAHSVALSRLHLRKREEKPLTNLALPPAVCRVGLCLRLARWAVLRASSSSALGREGRALRCMSEVYRYMKDGHSGIVSALAGSSCLGSTHTMSRLEDSRYIVFRLIDSIIITDQAPCFLPRHGSAPPKSQSSFTSARAVPFTLPPSSAGIRHDQVQPGLMRSRFCTARLLEMRIRKRRNGYDLHLLEDATCGCR